MRRAVRPHICPDWLRAVLRTGSESRAAGLNEWDFQGGGFMESFFRRLHPQAADPGLSDEDDSTVRLHLVLLVGRQLLRRV